MANLDIPERENLIERAGALEAELATAFTPLADLDAVSEVRTGLGAVTAVQLADRRWPRRRSRRCAAPEW